MQPTKIDILILGAGPAGTSLALMLLKRAPHLKVRIVEKSDFSREKTGETLPPQIKDLMEPLGIFQQFQQEGHLPAHGTSVVWGADLLQENNFLLQTSAPGWRIDKNRFNLFLIREAERRGAQININTQAKFTGRVQSLFHFLLTSSAGAEESLQASFVVDATGRSASFAAQMGARKVRFDNLTGIWRFYQLSNGNCGVETLVEACATGWWYSASMPGNKLVVAYMTDSDLAPEQQLRQGGWEHQLNSAPRTQKRLKKTEGAGELKFWPAASQCLDAFCGEAWIAVGDAAGTFDPLSSQGVFKAMKSGIFGAYAALDYLDGKTNALEKYEQLVKREFENYLEIRSKFYQKEQRWPQSPFWQRRQDWVTLDPFSMLVAVENSPPKSSQRNYLLSAKERAFILKTCTCASPAKDIVAAFQASALSYKSNRNIILGLQFLLQKNILKQVS